VGNLRLAPASWARCKLQAHTHGSIATVVCARDGPHARLSVFLPDLPRPKDSTDKGGSVRSGWLLFSWLRIVIAPGA
jgi:hypothetical protein